MGRMELAGTLIGPYRLQRRVGSGGMGQVFAAVNERTGQEVALKLLSASAAKDRQLVARFLQEGRALVKLPLPGVVHIFHCDQLEDGTVFLAMELLQGLSMRDWMRRHTGPVPRDAALAIGRQIAEVMADIHTRKIVHRDLKPENVFLCPDESVAPGYRIKLLDFGIAKVPPTASGAQVDTQIQTLEPIFLGTARYMAPEQFLAPAAVSGSADVYSLGVLIFELLAGRPPFDAPEKLELASMHLKEEPPLLREFAPATPGALSSFIASMLAKNPAERPTMLRCQDMLGRPWEDAQDECPIPGLSPFTEAQAELFFGRKAEREELLGLLDASRADRRRWVQIEGPSGIGKSSLVQAGLLPHLKERLSQEAPQWRIASLRPSHAPLRSLALALQAAYADTGLHLTSEELEAALLADPQALRTLVTAHTPPGCCLLLVIEQLEELFTLGDAERHRLDALVSTALTAPASPLRLLTTLRSDLIHRLEQLPLLARQLNEASRHSLRAMDEAALTQVIQGMAQRAGLRLSEGLPERMVRDATIEGSRLPLLGHTLRGLWALRTGALLTHERYEQLGGVGGALSQQAEQLLNGLGDDGRERAKWLILALVQVNREVPAIPRSCSRQEVLAAAGGDALAEDVLLRLSGMRPGSAAPADQALRLVTISAGPDPSQQRVELVHETLLQTVPSIASWLDDERARMERRTDLEIAARSWEQAGGPTNDLPTGTLLKHYLESTGASSSQPLRAPKASARAMLFLDAGKQLERKRVRLRRILFCASVAAVVAISFSAVLANQERRRAESTLQLFRELLGDLASDTDWKLSRRDFMLKVRQQLFEDQGRRLEKLSDEDREKPEIRLATIQAWQRRSDLAFHDVSLDQADHFLDLARASLDQGLRQQPEDFSLKFQLGLNHSKRGKVAQARGQEEARTLFNEAVQLFEHLQPKDEPNDRRTRATSYSELADLELASGRADIAMPWYDRALPLLEKNVQAKDLEEKALRESGAPEKAALEKIEDERRYEQSLLAETLGSRAKAAQVAGDPESSQRFFDRALPLARSISKREPENTYYRWVLARVLVQLADSQATRGEHDAAVGLYQKAQELGRALLKGEEPNKRYALVLGESLLGEEKLARATKDLARAAQRHDTRCALMGDFLRNDQDDTRFRAPDCG